MGLCCELPGGRRPPPHPCTPRPTPLDAIAALRIPQKPHNPRQPPRQPPGVKTFGDPMGRGGIKGGGGSGENKSGGVGGGTSLGGEATLLTLSVDKGTSCRLHQISKACIAVGTLETWAVPFLIAASIHHTLIGQQPNCNHESNL
jgi:hypothetical protein